jgi:hypothetical protein
VKLHGKKSTSAAMILIILTLSIISTSPFLVSADQGGTGKFLGIVFSDAKSEDATALRSSSCHVIAIKVSSEQEFRFDAVDDIDFLPDGETPVSLERVAAGTVELMAYPDVENGWRFSHWTYLDGTPLEMEENHYFYKTEKYGTLIAFFERATIDITVTVRIGTGSILYNNEVIATTGPTGELPGITDTAVVSVPYYDTPTFNFVGLDGDHLSAVIVDWNLENEYYADLVITGFGISYQFPQVEKSYTLDAFFSAEGEAYIPGGDGVTVFLKDQNQDVSLSFLSTVGAGSASGKFMAADTFDPSDVVVWEITVAADLGNGLVLVALVYPEGIPYEENLRIYRGDFNYDDFTACDFNGDGVIDGQDVSEIANRINGPIEPNDPEYNLEIYDLVRDGVINSDDLAFIHSVKDSVGWIDITSPFIDNPPTGGFPPGVVYPVDTVNNIVYGVTDHFSIFRGR